jgi:hypothetical protein
MKTDKAFWNLLLVQGIFILVTSLWALLHIESFMWVTGPKTDIWLVKTVAVMGICVSVTLLISCSYKEAAKSVVWLALSVPLGFAALDTYYYLKKTIIWVYLIDASLQVIFLIAYLVLFLRKNKGV